VQTSEEEGKRVVDRSTESRIEAHPSSARSAQGARIQRDMRVEQQRQLVAASRLLRVMGVWTLTGVATGDRRWGRKMDRTAPLTACPATEINELVVGGSGCAANHSTCDISCLEGFTKKDPKSSGQYTCSQSTGEWVPSVPKPRLVCVVVCDQKLPFPHADPVGCKGRMGRTLPIAGEQCTAECARGWVENGAHFNQYQCIAMYGKGSWSRISPGVLRCVRAAVPCESAVPAKNMHVDCSHKQAGVDCNATCDAGFKANGGDPGFVCDAQGRWVPKAVDPLDRLECNQVVWSWSNSYRLAIGLGAMVVMCLLCTVCTIWRRNVWPDCVLDWMSPRPGHQPASVLRESFLGGSQEMVRLTLEAQDSVFLLPSPSRFR
jgi:hypothetical protein